MKLLNPQSTVDRLFHDSLERLHCPSCVLLCILLSRLAILFLPNVGSINLRELKALWAGLRRLEDAGKEYKSRREALIPVIPKVHWTISMSSLATISALNTVLVRHCLEKNDVIETWPCDFGRHYSRFEQKLTDRACV